MKRSLGLLRDEDRFAAVMFGMVSIRVGGIFGGSWIVAGGADMLTRLALALKGLKIKKKFKNFRKKVKNFFGSKKFLQTVKIFLGKN